MTIDSSIRISKDFVMTLPRNFEISTKIAPPLQKIFLSHASWEVHHEFLWHVHCELIHIWSNLYAYILIVYRCMYYFFLNGHRICNFLLPHQWKILQCTIQTGMYMYNIVKVHRFCYLPPPPRLLCSFSTNTCIYKDSFSAPAMAGSLYMNLFTNANFP